MVHNAGHSEKDIVMVASPETYIQDVLNTWQAPGAAVAVLQGDDVLVMEGFGWRNVAEKLPMTAQTRFAIASCTKAFTAMGVALLVDEGLLEWDKPVRDYMPDFRLKDDYATQHTTPRDLLSHRTGVPRHDLAWFGTDFSREQLIHNLRYLEPFTSFRGKYYYQNMMYMTAGYLCGYLTGQSWESFIQDRIFNVLGMHNSTFGPWLDGGQTAVPYRFRRKLQTVVEMAYYDASRARDYDPLGPAGGIYSTVEDLGLWLKVHLNHGYAGDVQLVSAHNLREMHAPQMIMPASGFNEELFGTTLNAYGMGWTIRPYKGFTLIQHNGAIDGFRALISVIPQPKLGIVALVNLDQKNVPEALTYGLIDHFLDVAGDDWQKRFFEIDSAILEAQDKGERGAIEDRVADASPTHDPMDYTGDYTAEGYADLRIKFENQVLHAWLAGEWNRLEHYHYDIFELYLELWDTYLKLSFVTDTTGSVDSVFVPIEPEVEPVVFKKKPITVDETSLDVLTGVYVMPIAGMDVTISLKQGDLYVTVSGQSTEQLLPHRQLNHTISFKVKDDANTLFEFAADGSHLQVKQGGMLFDAPRKLY